MLCWHSILVRLGLFSFVLFCFALLDENDRHRRNRNEMVSADCEERKITHGTHTHTHIGDRLKYAHMSEYRWRQQQQRQRFKFKQQ